MIRNVSAEQGVEQEVVPPDRILDDAQEDVAPVRVDRIALGQEDAADVIERAAGRDHLVGVRPVEGQEVGDLLAVRVDDGELLTSVQGERHPGARRNFMPHAKPRSGDERGRPKRRRRRVRCTGEPRTPPHGSPASD